MKPKPRYQPGDKIGGRYQVHQALMGGMGEVYLCLDLEEMYPYALKTFQQRYLTQARKLRTTFEQEVSTWVALEKHPNIVRCFYMDILDNQPFMVLEWIAGEEGKGTDLRGWLRHGPLDLQTALDFTIDICRGLVHAQEKQPGLVHRDLKPENILIAQGGLAKITDFGLAQIVGGTGLELAEAESETQTEGRQSLVRKGGIAGTPAYMAPEQWRGESLDERTDIYALGCILYEMLNGQAIYRVDFPPTTPQQFSQWLRAKQSRHESSNIPHLPSGLPAALDDLLQNCLAKTRTERPVCLSDLLVRLTNLYQQQFDQDPPGRPDPSDFTAVDYNNRGVTYDTLRRYDLALADYGQAIKLSPNYGKAYINLGGTHINLGNYEVALDNFNRAIQIDPPDAQAYANRGLTYDKFRRYEEALADYNRAIQLDPNFALAYTNRGLTYSKLQEYEKALADHNKAVELSPAYANAYNNRGIIYDKMQQYSKALADYNRAIQIDSTFVQVYANRGLTYHNLKQYDLALTDYSQAIRLDPKFAVAYTNRGLTFDCLQQHDQALADHSQAIECDPTYAQAHFNRGTSYANLQLYDKAITDYNRAIELDPQYVDAYFSRGTAYVGLQRLTEALIDFSQVIELKPCHIQAYINRGSTYVALKRIDEALADFNQAIQVDPNNATAYYNRANIYHHLRQFGKALADLNQTIRLDPTDAQAFFEIGVLYANCDKLCEAIPYLKQASQLGYPQGTQAIAVIEQKLKEQNQ